MLLRPVPFTLLAACVGLAPIPAATAAPDDVFYGGKVLTVDASFSVQTSFAVENGRLTAIGDVETVRALAEPGRTRLHDLEGRMVLPGLIDSHVHAPAAAMTEFDHEVPSMVTIPEVVAYIEARAQVVPAGDWIVVNQIFVTRLKEERMPSRAELDAAAPGHPVAFRIGPDAILNSAGLAAAGIDRNFEVTDGGPGYVERDAGGEPTGLVRGLSRYLNPIIPPDRPATDKERSRRLRMLMRDYNHIGITTICDRAAPDKNVALYQDLLDRNEQTVRVAISHTFQTVGPMDEVFASIDRIAASPLRHPNAWLHIIGTKAFLDGGMLTGSSYMLKPWGKSAIYGIADAAYRGVLNIPPDRLYQMVKRVASHGMQFTAHSVGDGAVSNLIDAYEKVNREIPLADLRMCITHSNFMNPELIRRAADLHLVADLQPIWLWLDARTLIHNFGYERMRHFQPLHSLMAAGVVIGGGSDHMMKIGDTRSINPYNPFLGMWIAITRRARWYDGRVHFDEALSRRQAIEFYTRNNAWLLFWEKEIGSLEPGKRADFIVLDRDLLKCPLNDIRDTRVLQTWLDGRLIRQPDDNPASP